MQRPCMLSKKKDNVEWWQQQVDRYKKFIDSLYQVVREFHGDCQDGKQPSHEGTARSMLAWQKTFQKYV